MTLLSNSCGSRAILQYKNREYYQCRGNLLNFGLRFHALVTIKIA
jgi:hypothetical protein